MIGLIAMFVLGFIFAFYLLTRKDSNAKKHGMIQLVLLIIEFGIIGILIFTGQMDPNIILNLYSHITSYAFPCLC